MTCELFKKSFLDRVFPREKSKTKVVEFINLRQGGMSVLEYSLKVIKLSKYTPSLVSDPWDEMNRLVMGYQKTCNRSIIQLCDMTI